MNKKQSENAIRDFTTEQAKRLDIKLDVILGTQSVVQFLDDLDIAEELYSDDRYFTLGNWVSAWLDNYNDKSHINAIFVVQEGTSFKAIVPVYLSKKSINNKYLLQPIGQGEPESEEVMTEYQDIIVSTELKQVMGEFLTLFAQRFCYQMRWKNALKSSVIATHFSSYIVSTPLTRFQRIKSKSKADFNDFSANTNKQLKRLSNRLSKLRHKFYWADANDSADIFNKLLSLHEQRWARDNYSGAMAGERFRTFQKQLIQHTDTVKFSVLEIDKVIVAIHYYFYIGETLYFYQSGWKQGEYDSLSPGFLLHVWSMQNCDAKIYDFMISKPDNRIKNQLSNKKVPACSIDFEVDKFYCVLIRIVNRLKRMFEK